MHRSYKTTFHYKNLCYGILSMAAAILTAILFFLSLCIIEYTMIDKNPGETSSNYETYDATQNKAEYSLQNTKKNILSQSSRNTLFSSDFGLFKLSVTLFVFMGSYIGYFSIFTKNMQTYLEEIQQGIAELSIGNLTTQIPLRGEGELKEIASNLNRMTVHIKEIIETERNMEDKKNELITNVAHDLRTPLTSIIGYLDIVSNKTIQENEKNRYIQIAFEKSKRLEKLTDDLFTYTKLEFGQIALHLSCVDMVKMLEQMIEEFYPSFCEANLTYEFLTTQNHAFVEADGDLLARALANLLSNAIKYGKDGKNISIALKTQRKKVYISITNYGEVIPEEDLQKIFEKFYRVDSSRNEFKGGTGLGLAIAKNIIEMHHGVITGRSSFDGTVFEVVLDEEEKNEEVS